MLRLACILAIVSAASTPLSCAPAPTPPEGWFFYPERPEAFECGLDFDVVHSGHSSVCIRSTPDYDARTDRVAMLNQSFSAACYRGKRIRYTGWFKTENVQGDGARLWLRVDRVNGASAGFDNMDARPLKGTADWKQYAIVLDVDKDAVDLNFGILLVGAGRIWVDTLMFEEVPLEVPVTGGKYGAGPFPQALANPDFEPSAPAPGNGPDSPSVPGWEQCPANPGACEYKLDTAVLHAGKASACIRTTPEFVRGGNGLTQSVSAETYQGKRVRFSGWLKTDDVQGDGARLDRAVDSADRWGIARDNMGERPVKGTSGWQEYAIVLDVAKDAVTLRLGVWLMGPGRLWADTLKLEEVGPDVPVTGVRGEGWLSPKGPANLDCELMPPQN